MSTFTRKRSRTPITEEEARAAVETELFALKLTRPMTSAEKDAFCEIANSSLNYQSNSYRVREIRLWVESWQSLWLPEKVGPGEDVPVAVGMVDAAAGKLRLPVPWSRWTGIILRAVDTLRSAIRLHTHHGVNR
jgi:hypothetical protein